MRTLAPTPSRPAPSPLVVWVATALAAAALAFFGSEEPLVVVAVVALAAGAAVLLAAFAEPRWVILVQVFLTACYGVYLLPGHLGVSFTPETLVILLGVALAFRHLLGIERLRLPGREALVFFALLCAMVASLPFAADTGLARYDITTFVRNALVVLVLAVLLDSADWLRKAMWAFVLGAGLLALVAVAQQLTGTYDAGYLGFASISEDRGLRRSAGGLDPNFFGAVLAATVPMALYLGLLERRRELRLFGFATALVSLVAIWFTYSRSSLVIVVLVLALVAVLRRANLPALVLAVACCAVLVLVLPTRDAVERNFTSLLPSEEAAGIGDVSARGRASEAVAAVRMFMDYPVLGVGAGNYSARYLDYSQEIGLDQRSEARSTHNLYLEALAELGIVGASIFFGLIAMALGGAWRARRHLAGRERLVAEGTAVAFLSYLLSGLTLHLAYPLYFWLLLALALAAGRLVRPGAARRPAENERGAGRSGPAPANGRPTPAPG